MLTLITGPTTLRVRRDPGGGDRRPRLRLCLWSVARGTRIGGRAPRVVTAWTTAFVGTDVPLRVAASAARSLTAGVSPATVMLVATLILPTTISLGIAFPLAMELAGGHDEHVAWRVGAVYSMNTIAAIGGALAAGFVAIPAWGLQGTLELVSVLLAARTMLPQRSPAVLCFVACWSLAAPAAGGCRRGPYCKPGVGPGGVGERRVS